jgi:hypothetical protein
MIVKYMQDALDLFHANKEGLIDLEGCKLRSCCHVVAEL